MSRAGAFVLVLSLGLLPSLLPGAVHAGAPRFRVSNLARASFGEGTLPMIDGTWAVFPVSERSQGGADLNGDGDPGDWVVSVLDIDTGSTTILGLATRPESRPRIGGGIVAFLVDEERQGATDLNGDGDARDQVVHVHDLFSGQTTNLGLAASGFAFDGGLVAFLVAEERRADLNGDGDTVDDVLHVYDGRSGTLRNLGLATTKPEVAAPLVASPVVEADQGQDLDGDGQTNGFVVHVFDASTGVVTNLGVHSLGTTMSSRLVVSFALEPLARADLNGDGDRRDGVVHVYDALTGIQTNLGLAASSGDPVAVGDLLAFGVSEEHQGGQDLNQDGDLRDDVLHVHDATRGVTTSMGLASGSHEISGDRISFLVPESEQRRRDLNGDGDADDRVAHFFDRRNGRVTNLGLACNAAPQIDGFRTLLLVRESRQGNQDLNGDGDTSDSVVFVHDLLSDSILNLGLAQVGELRLAGPLLLLSPFEGAQGRSDLNGDGDVDDHVIHGVNLVTQESLNLGLASGFGGAVFVSDGRGLCGVTEANHGADLNGDGDRDDTVVHLIELDGAEECRSGSVNAGAGAVTDVLFVNGASGSGAERRVEYRVLEPLEVRIDRPPAMTPGETAQFAIYLWPGEPPTNRPGFTLPFRMGCTAMPMPLTFGAEPQPLVVWNTAGRFRKLGRPTHPASPAPSILHSRPRTLRPRAFYIQGLIEDPGSAADAPASVTNGVLAVPVFR